MGENEAEALRKGKGRRYPLIDLEERRLKWIKNIPFSILYYLSFVPATNFSLLFCTVRKFIGRALRCFGIE